MKGVLIFVAGTAGACAIAVPAVIGLSGTPSFSQRIPVRAPAAAHIVSFDDQGRAVEKEGPAHPTPTPRSTVRPSATLTPTPERSSEPGDDRGSSSGRRHGGGSSVTSTHARAASSSDDRRRGGGNGRGSSGASGSSGSDDGGHGGGHDH